RLGLEEHGAGRQLVRVRTWPRAGWAALVLIVVLAGLAALAAAGDAATATIVLAAFAGLVLGRLVYECSLTCATVRASLRHAFVDPEPEAATDRAGVRAESERTRVVDLVQLSSQMRRAPSQRIDRERVGER